MNNRAVITAFLVMCLVVLPVDAESDHFPTTVFTIELIGDGTAIWTIEEKIILSSGEDRLAWDNFTGNFEEYREGISQDYEQRITEIVSGYGEDVKRDMYPDGFEVEVYTNETITATYGVTMYRFVWHGFGVPRGDAMMVGDAFSYMSLLSGDVLIISIPEAYELNDITPKPDEIRDDHLIWYGYRTFYDGEPAFDIEIKKGPYSVYIALTTIFIAAIFAGYFILMNREEKDVFQEISNVNTKSDKEIIKDILQERGGEAYQSDLVSETCFSKSKVSNLIKEMNEEGDVIKIKKGVIF